MISLPIQSTQAFSHAFEATDTLIRIRPENPDDLPILGTGTEKIVIDDGDSVICVVEELTSYRANTSKILSNIIHELSRVNLFPCYCPETLSCYSGRKSIVGFPGFRREKVNVDLNKKLNDKDAYDIYSETRNVLANLNPAESAKLRTFIYLDIESNNGNLVYTTEGQIAYIDLPCFLSDLYIEIDSVSFRNYLNTNNCPCSSIEIIIQYVESLIELQQLYHKLSLELFELSSQDIENTLIMRSIPKALWSIVYEGIEMQKEHKYLIQKYSTES